MGLCAASKLPHGIPARETAPYRDVTNRPERSRADCTELCRIVEDDA